MNNCGVFFFKMQLSTLLLTYS